MSAGTSEEAADDSHATASASAGSELYVCIGGQGPAGTGLLGPAHPQVPAVVGVLVGDTVLGHSDEVAPGDPRWGWGAE